MRVEIYFSLDKKVQQTIIGNRCIMVVRKHIRRPIGLWAAGMWTKRRFRALPIHDVQTSDIATHLQAKYNN